MQCENHSAGSAGEPFVGLSPTDFARLGETLDELERTEAESPHVVNAVRLLALTGCRVGEVLRLRWQDVDFEGRCLRLPESKIGPRTVKLTAPALELLTGLERFDGSEHVIGSPLQSLRDEWARIRRQAGLEGVPIHALRHGVTSAGGAGGRTGG